MRQIIWVLGIIPLAVLAAGLFYGCGSIISTAETTTTTASTTTTTSTTTSTSTTTTSSTSTTTTSTSTSTTTSTLQFALSSSAFSLGSSIPARFAATDMTGGLNNSPPLQWSNPPAGTQAYALAMIDSSANNFVHWHIINIPSTEISLAENASATGMPAGSSQLFNEYLTAGYGGPAPPSGETHTYKIRLYALSGTLEAMMGFVGDANFTTTVNTKKIAEATLSGTYYGTN